VSQQEIVLPVDASSVYVDWLCAQVGAGALRGLRVVLDCANGAASTIAPVVFERLGATVTTIHATPDGRNINDGCGSTHLDSLQAAVVDRRADLGLAFDGDADRVLAVDERGEVVDGDQIMAIMAIAMRERGDLSNDTIAITVMSNLGLRHALAEHGISFVETPVGDRQVVAAMERDDLALGGEQSGHIIFGHRSRTGDGALTGLLLAARAADTSRPLSELAAVVNRLPQVLVNVPVRAHVDLTGGAVAAAVADVEDELGDDGRVLVRPSGTEPLVRVMVEAPTTESAAAAAQRIIAAIESTP
jgi:phosphoglucosamine mutase